MRRSGKRSCRWSILPAITLEGYIVVDIYQESYNAFRFNEFIHLRVLPQCISGWLVLIIDNANSHRSDELKKLCREAGVELAFLPPYSPDFNPIEQSFHALKMWIRRNQKLTRSRRYKNDFEAFLWLAVRSFMEGKDARGYFQSSYIGGDEEC